MAKRRVGELSKVRSATKFEADRMTELLMFIGEELKLRRKAAIVLITIKLDGDNHATTGVGIGGHEDVMLGVPDVLRDVADRFQEGKVPPVPSMDPPGSPKDPRHLM